MVRSELSQMSLSSSSWDSSESRVKFTVAASLPLPAACLRKGRFPRPAWPQMIADMRDVWQIQQLLDRLLVEWRASKQAGENDFLAWRARKTLCTPRRKDCGYLYDADKDLDVLAIFFRCSPWARRAWLTFRRLLTHETESEQTRHFYGLFARLQHCSTIAGWKSSPRSCLRQEKKLTGKSTVGAEQFYGWSMCSRNYQKKKRRNYRIRKGGGGWGGRACGNVPS